MDSLEWKLAIVDMVRVLQQMAEADVDHLWEYHLPEGAASPEELSAVEREVGEPLHPSYRAFLQAAGGWQCAYQDVDIFGPGDLLGGPRMEQASKLLAYLKDIVLVGSGYRREDLLPIACSRVSLDLFVIARADAPSPGRVIWFSGREIASFTDFDECFLALLEYDRRQVVYFRTGEWPPG